MEASAGIGPGHRRGSKVLWAAAACHGVAALLFVAFGATYLARSEFLPYHRQAIGLEWKALLPSLQVVLLALMRVAGGALLAVGLSMLALLAIPFRRGEAWARWAVAGLGAVAGVAALHATVLVRTRTPGESPVVVVIAGLGFIALGFLLSLLHRPPRA